MDKENKHKIVTFNVECTMKARWADQFIGMLKQMQALGVVGGSKKICFYSDGDGDFRPKFEVYGYDPIPTTFTLDENANRLYDAG